MFCLKPKNLEFMFTFCKKNIYLNCLENISKFFKKGKYNL